MGCSNSTSSETFSSIYDGTDQPLISKVEKEKSPKEQLRILFDALGQDPYEKPAAALEEPIGILTLTMTKLERFLSTDEAFLMKDEDLRQSFYGVDVYPLPDEGGRGVSYQGFPALFGEAGASMRAFYQNNGDTNKTSYRLYDGIERSIEQIAFVKSNTAEDVLVIAGHIRSHPREVFVDGFKISSNGIVNEPVLDEFQDTNWIVSADGSIRRNGDSFVDCRIDSFAASSITIKQGDIENPIKLKLIYDGTRFVVS